MKTTLRLETGRLGATMKRRVARLSRLSLATALLRPSLWTRARPQARILKSLKAPAMGAEATSAAMALLPIAKHSAAPPLATRFHRASEGASALVRATPLTTRKPLTRSRRSLSQSQGATRTLSAPSSISRISGALQRAAQPGKSVGRAIPRGRAARLHKRPAASQALEAREPSLRRPATQAIANGPERRRSTSANVRVGQQSRLTSDLAAEVNRKADQQPQSLSQSRGREAINGLSRPFTSGSIKEERSRAGHGSGEQGDDQKLSLSGDFVVDGRRLGELALNSASRGGASAQTGARNPNFRRNALPSGLSAPLP